MSPPALTQPTREPGAQPVHLLIALCLFAAAQILFLGPHTRLLALAVFAGAVWLARRAGLGRGATPPEPGLLAAELLPRGATLALLALIVAIAAFFRLWHLASVPPGLYVDEVLNARNAFAWRLGHGAWYGSRPLSTSGWVETSNLYLAYASGVLRLFGDGFLGVRMISVLPSLAMVPLTYLLGAVLGGRRVGLVAAFLLACSHWAGRTGRTGWDQVLMTALALAVVFLLLLALRRGRLWPAAPAGLLLGLSLYTYLASRLVALQVAVWLGWEAWSGARRRIAAAAALCLALAAVAAAPYFWYLETHTAGGPDVRVRELSLGQAGAGEGVARTLAENVVAHLLMFNARGAHYVRDDLPDYPMLDPLTGTLFLAGLAVAFGPPGWRLRALAAWVGAQLLGGVLSVSSGGPPYAYRVAGLAPWACLIAALGAVASWECLAPAGARAGWRRLAAASALLLLLAAGAANGWVLFVRDPAVPGIELAYGTVETRAGLWLADHRAGRPCYVVRDVFWTLRPYRKEVPYQQVNARNFYRRAVSLTAVQLAAGLYRTSPERALDPTRPNGEIDLVGAPPPRVDRPAVILLPRGQVARVRGRYRLVRREDVTDPDGRALFTALEVEPGGAGRTRRRGGPR